MLINTISGGRFSLEQPRHDDVPSRLSWPAVSSCTPVRVLLGAFS